MIRFIFDKNSKRMIRSNSLPSSLQTLGEKAGIHWEPSSFSNATYYGAFPLIKVLTYIDSSKYSKSLLSISI